MTVARFRTDYDGEFVITQTVWSAGKKQQKREWIPNTIENHHISGRACCILSSIGKSRFDYTILQRHRGGLLGSKKMQTYGTGEISQEMRLDFAIETNDGELNNIIERDYQKNNIVYTTARNLIAHPGHFYLIPFTPKFSSWAMLPYLAAFDGHREIFLVGYHNELQAPTLSCVKNLANVISAYSGVKFYIVGDKNTEHKELLNFSNVTKLDYREFITYCDI